MSELTNMLEYVKGHTGIEIDDEAATFLEAVVRVFAESLTRTEAQHVARELPEPARRWAMDVRHGDICSPEELRERVEQRIARPERVAIEWMPVALAALFRELSPKTQQWLARRLGHDWGTLLTAPDRLATPTQRRSSLHDIDRPRTLAEGRPGSARPLNDSPLPRQPDSLAVDNPHEDQKISSAEDVHADPLSSSKPGSQRPLSEGSRPK